MRCLVNGYHRVVGVLGSPSVVVDLLQEKYMVDKSGGDAVQGNAAMQGSVSGQVENVIGTGGAGVNEAMGGAGMAAGMAADMISQGQSQGNMAMTGAGGSDNTQADTNINV